MEIQLFGANALCVTTKKSGLLVDPYLYGAKLPKDISKKSEVVLLTQSWSEMEPPSEANFVINSPGEYEIKDFSIKAMATKLHSDDPSAHAAGVIYKVEVGEYNLAILGHTKAPLTDEQIEFLGIVDILSLPIGGNGYSLEVNEAVQIVKIIEPKVILPTHWRSKNIKYPVDQNDYSAFVAEVGLPEEKESRLKIKGLLPETAKVVILEEQAS